MQVELYIGNTDNTWHTTFVDIPDDTPEEAIEELAIAELDTSTYQQAAFVGLYHYDSSDDDDPDEHYDDDDQWDDVFDDDFIGDQDPYGGDYDESRDDLP